MTPTKKTNKKDQSEDTKRRRKPSAVTGLLIAEYLSRNPHGARLVDISNEIGMDRAQAHRMVNAMVDDGWLIPVGSDGSYSLTARTIRMGSTFISRLDLSEHARPFLDDLSRRAKESVFLGELRKDVVVCVGRRVADHSLRVWTEMGDSWPIDNTAMGTAILAGRHLQGGGESDDAALPEEVQIAIRDGYARDFGRYRDGIQAVAAPILNASGSAIGAISLSGPRTRFDDDKIASMGLMVRDTAKAISDRLGYHAEQSTHPQGEAADT